MSLTLTLATVLKKTVKNSYHVVLVDDNSQTMGQLTSELQTAVSRLIEASRFKGKLADTYYGIWVIALGYHCVME